MVQEIFKKRSDEIDRPSNFDKQALKDKVEQIRQNSMKQVLERQRAALAERQYKL